MANGALLSDREPARVMLVGYPGTAKTGAIAALANAGFKIRMLDFDGNYVSLLKFTKPEFRSNIDIVTLEDSLKALPASYLSSPQPTAFAKGLKLMDRWEYMEGETKVDLGSSDNWGMDTVVVLDSLTAMGECAFRRAMALSNKTPTNVTQQVWGLAMKEQDQFIEKLTSPRNRFHVIVTAHLKMISPKDIQKDDSDLTKELKERAVELIPTRLFPSALGQGLPPTIGGHFPTILLAENQFSAKGVPSRKLVTVSRPELDLKLPAPNLPASFDIEDGLVEVFKLITPGIKECLADHGKQ